MKTNIQKSCRAILRPLAQVARKALTPTEPPLVFDWHQVEAGVAAGSSLLLPKTRAISDLICSGEYEKRILQFVSALVNENHCCYDIGGHYGYYTMALSKLARQGSVHTFEPVSEHANRIERAVKKSQFARTNVHPMAVAGENGTLTLKFAADAGDDSMAYLDVYGGVDTAAAHEHYQHFKEMTVNAITIDQAAQQFGVPQFIKIDAEGAEGAILEGARELLRSDRPRLLIEVHGIHEAMHCSEVLTEMNYQAIMLSEQKTTLPILWTHQSDQDAKSIVEEILQMPPTIFFRR